MMSFAIQSILVTLLLLPGLATGSEESPSEQQERSPCRGAIRVSIVAETTDLPLRGVTVVLSETECTGESDSSGAFESSDLPCGRYHVRFSHVGYETQTVPVTVAADGRTVVVRLAERPAHVADMVVTAPRPYRVDTAATAHAVMTRQELETAPQIANDLYRAVARLPGVQTNDFSARFAVRGGDYEEVLVTLDGMELRRPFHVQDVDGGLISIVDIEAVDSVDLMTGAFPAQYGNRLSGVLNFTSRRPPEGKHRQSAGINFIDMRAMSEGVFAGRRGSWLLTARRGYAEYLAPAAVDSQYSVRPMYYDAFTRLRYALSGKHCLSAHVLFGEDHFGFSDDSGLTADGRSRNLYGWLTLESAYGSRLSSATVLSVSGFSHDRKGQAPRDSNGRTYPLSDIAETDLAGIRHEASIMCSRAIRLRTGAELRQETTRYQCERRAQLLYDAQAGQYRYYWVSREYDSSFTSWLSGAWVNSLLRIMKPITIEVGVRYDHASHIQGSYVDPRLAIAWEPNQETTCRLGFGRYHQYQGVDELIVGDGEREFCPAEQAVHIVAGIDRNLGHGIGVRLEAYRKSYSHLRPRYRSSSNQYSIFPEVYSDRMRVDREGALSRGLEVHIERQTGGMLQWRLCYTWAKATESVSGLRYALNTIDTSFSAPAPHDRRHTLSVDLCLRPSQSWRFGLAWQCHTGTRHTNFELQMMERSNGLKYPKLVMGDLNGARHPLYHRLDLRIDRFWTTPVGDIAVFLELINLYGKGNIRTTIFEVDRDGPINDPSWYLDRTDWYWMPFVPSLGFRWTWEG